MITIGVSSNETVGIIRNDYGPLSASSAGVTAITVLVGLLYRYYSTRLNERHQAKERCSPSPPPLCSASISDTFRAFGYGGLPDFMIRYREKHGTIFRLQMPSLLPMVVVLADTEDCREIVNNPRTIKPWILYRAMSTFTTNPSIGSIEGVPEGDAWYHRRKGINPAFAPKLVQRMMDIAHQLTDQFISNKLSTGDTQEEQEDDEKKKEEKTEQEDNTREEVELDIGHEMVKLTIAILCEAAFEYTPSEEERESLLLEIKLGWAEFSLKTAVNPFRCFGSWFLPDRKRAIRSLQILQSFAKKIIQQHKLKKNPNPNTVIDMIVNNPNYQNDEERYADIVFLLFAGHDTTGFTLGLTLLELAKNPQEQTKLRNELILQHTNNSSTVGGTGGAIEQTVFLKQVVKESMRLNPVVPFVVKQLGEDYTTKNGGYLLPKGSIVFTGMIAISRNPTAFENPNKFDPSRWDAPTEEMKRASFPFSLGKRNCAGQTMANAEIHTVLAKLIREFEFTIVDEGQINWPATVRLDNCMLRMKKVSS